MLFRSLLTTLTHLGAKIKDMTSAEEMWKTVKNDVIKQSTLYLLDAEDQLCSMKLSDNDDLKAHLTEQHFQLISQCCDNLIKMGSTLSDSQFNTIIMTSLPESYCPTLQMITAAEWASKLSGSQFQQMKLDDLIAFITEEAQHCVINNKRSKNAELALVAHAKKARKGKVGKKKKQDKSSKSDSDSEETCGKSRHGRPDYFLKGGGKEGQAPWQKKSKKEENGDSCCSSK